jgi:hypothetical protein
MKRIKKEKAFSKEYYPVVVWLDDLQELYDILKKQGGEVDISNDDYKFESIEDATNHFGRRPQYSLTLSGSKPYSQVEFTRLWTRLYVSAGPDSARTYYDLDEVLIRSQRRFPFLYNYWLAVPIWLTSFIPDKWTTAAGLPPSGLITIPIFVWLL